MSANIHKFAEITREMGTNHKDFMRLLPKSIANGKITYHGDEDKGAHVLIEGAPSGQIEIDLSKVGERRIALLCLPVTFITFRFYGLSEEAALIEFTRMSKSFHRGGG